MRFVDARDAARGAKSANPSRPATAVILDTPDARLVVFRILPGQSVPPHQSPSSVLLTIIEGKGEIIGPDGPHDCSTGDLIAFGPDETHGMTAIDTEMHVLATITPRPGERPSAGPARGAA
jgi:quercetin dioxygenase-like cupin family protein